MMRLLVVNSVLKFVSDGIDHVLNSVVEDESPRNSFTIDSV
jgi:hypothetical protein